MAKTPAPRVSVIIPAYNNGNYIGETIRSVMTQKLGVPFELIVVDDGSIDNTQDVIKGLSGEFKNIKHKRIQNTGSPSAPRNIAMGMAEGDFIAFLDSDDVYKPGFLQRMYDAMNQDGLLALVCSNAEVIDAEGAIIHKQYLKKEQLKSGQVFNDLIQDNFVITSSVLVRKTVLEEVGGFMEDLRYDVCADYDEWLRIALNHKIQCVDEPLIQYRHHDKGISKQNAWRATGDIIVVLKHQLSFSMSQAQRRVLFQAIAYRYRVLFEENKRFTRWYAYTGWFVFSLRGKIIKMMLYANPSHR